MNRSPSRLSLLLSRHTRRREFITLAGGAAFARPFASRAQEPDRLRRLGALMALHADDPQVPEFVAALVQGLAALDWRDGANLRIDWRWSGADPELFARYAAELLALGPDVVLAQSTPGLAAVRRQTSAIPIVFAVVTDPVAQGFVDSLGHPGGNVTGFTDLDPPMAGKWLALLAQLTPPVARVAVLFNPATAPFGGMMMRAIEDAAPSLALVARAAPCTDEAEIAAVGASLASDARGGLLVLPDVYMAVHRAAIIAAAAEHRLPAVYPFRSFMPLGGLMSYSVDNPDLFRRAAVYVDRILKGAAPGDLPVQQPTKFLFTINLKTARTLGVTIPTPLLAIADEIIE